MRHAVAKSFIPEPSGFVDGLLELTEHSRGRNTGRSIRKLESYCGGEQCGGFESGCGRRRNPLRHYALWDIYFHESATPGRGTAPVNLMIKQRVVDPDGYEQDTESGGEAAVTHTFSGITFRENKNSGLKSGSRIVVELFATPVVGDDMGIDDMTLDLKEVIDFYVKDGSILSTDYLTSIQTGWEVLAGGTFVTHDFWTALQDEPEPTN